MLFWDTSTAKRIQYMRNDGLKQTKDGLTAVFSCLNEFHDHMKFQEKYISYLTTVCRNDFSQV